MSARCLLLTLGLVPSSLVAQDCTIPVSDNPHVTLGINPSVTFRWNPDVTFAINPDVTFSINPNVTYRYNPNVTYSINPDVTTRLSPYASSWTGFHLCSTDGSKVGAAVVANDDVIILFAGGDWIGHFVTNRRGGYNFFNRQLDWRGFLVPTASGGFAFFDRDKNWVFALLR